MIEVVGGEGRSRMGIKYVDKQAEIKEFCLVINCLGQSNSRTFGQTRQWSLCLRGYQSES